MRESSNPEQKHFDYQRETNQEDPYARFRDSQPVNPLVSSSTNVRTSFASNFLNNSKLFESYQQNAEANLATNPPEDTFAPADDEDAKSHTSVPTPETDGLNDHIHPNTAMNQMHTSFEHPQAQESLIPNQNPARAVEAPTDLPQLYFKIQSLEDQNKYLQVNLQNAHSYCQNADQRVQELQRELESERSANHHKIGFLLREKQDIENKCYQQQDMIRKYASALEQLQRETQAEKEMLNSSSSAIHQSKMREEDLRRHIEELQYKINESENNLMALTEELNTFRAENENLQIDLKSLVNIEQALRNELNHIYQRYAALEDYVQKINAKIMEDQENLSLTMEENENMKQDLLQFHRTIEVGMRENDDLKREVSMLREELHKKHQDNSHSATSLADKDNEIFALKAELARTKAMLSSQPSRELGSEFKNNSSLEMLLRQNSDSFAHDYLKNLNVRTQKDEGSFSGYSSFDNTPVGGRHSKEERKYDMKDYISNKQNQHFPKPNMGGYNTIQSALPEAKPEPPRKGPKTVQGLPPNSKYRKQEWTPYD